MKITNLGRSFSRKYMLQDENDRFIFVTQHYLYESMKESSSFFSCQCDKTGYEAIDEPYTEPNCEHVQMVKRWKKESEPKQEGGKHNAFCG